MSTPSHKAERILNILRELPPAKVNEVIEFAECLKAKTRKIKPHEKNTSELPCYHLSAVDQKAFERSSLYGEHNLC